MRKYILVDRQPVLCDNLLKWAKWMQEPNQSIIKQQKIKGCFISTIFLGLDHGWRLMGNNPVLFETMIFNKENNLCNGYRERCCTYEQAELMHKRAVEMVKVKIKKLDENIKTGQG